MDSVWFWIFLVCVYIFVHIHYIHTIIKIKGKDAHNLRV